jgi:hypothetical protein
VAHLARGLAPFGSRSRDQLRDLLRRFFYLDRVFEQCLDEVWEEFVVAEALGGVQTKSGTRCSLRRRWVEF